MRVNQGRGRVLMRDLYLPGTMVGYFQVLEYVGSGKGNGRVKVRDTRCGHVGVQEFSPSRGYRGKRSLCNCPIYEVDRKGYVHWRWSSPSGETTRIMEHRIVMERELGRELRKGEEVHHKNGVRGDNSPGNLELWLVSQPKGQRVEDLVEHAKEVLTRYDPDSLATSNRSA
jgi:hypothetical protein